MGLSDEPGEIFESEEAFLIFVEYSEKLNAVVVRDWGNDLSEGLDFFGE